jgi:serine/threonine protein kinase
MGNSESPIPHETFGRYVLYAPIANGGMASVHPARLVGAEGFHRLVAAKRLHPRFATDAEFVSMFHDEARIASKIHHLNVVPVLDLEICGGEVLLVQEYVHGVPLSQLQRIARETDSPIPVPIVAAILGGTLAGLHAAHEAKDESGQALHIVHRDVSPQNVLVTLDGIPKVLDFGIAKATTSSHHTRAGVFKGKLAYVAPEQIRIEHVTRRADIYAVGVVAWELLTNRRFRTQGDDADFVAALFRAPAPSILEVLEPERARFDRASWTLLEALAPIVSRAMDRSADQRFATAEEMFRALLVASRTATTLEVAEWVRSTAADCIEERERVLAANDESWRRISLEPGSAGSIRTGFGWGDTIRPSLRMPMVQTAARKLREWTGPRSLAAVAGAIGVVGILLGTSIAGRSSTPSAKDVHGAAVAPLPASAFETLRPSPAPAPTQAASQAPPVPPPSSPAVPPLVSAPQVSRPSGAPVSRPRFDSRPRTAAPSPAPQSPPMAPSTPPPSVYAPKGECDPPFVFVGTKKVFKSQCL